MAGKQSSQNIQALDPLRPGLLQPWKDYVTRGLITIKVEFSPTGTLVFCTALRDLAIPEGIDPERIPLGIARECIKAANLDGSNKGKKGGQQKAPPKPLRNLRVDEFNEDTETLTARIRAVAQRIAGNTAYGRISSQNLLKEGVTDFQSWWDASTARERAMVFILAKDIETADSDTLSRIDEVFRSSRCPFRGTLVPEKNQVAEGETAAAAETSAPARSNAIRRPNGNTSRGPQ